MVRLYRCTDCEVAVAADPAELPDRACPDCDEGVLFEACPYTRRHCAGWDGWHCGATGGCLFAGDENDVGGR